MRDLEFYSSLCNVTGSGHGRRHPNCLLFGFLNKFPCVLCAVPGCFYFSTNFPRALYCPRLVDFSTNFCVLCSVPGYFYFSTNFPACFVLSPIVCFLNKFPACCFCPRLMDFSTNFCVQFLSLFSTNSRVTRNVTRCFLVS